ncbi:MAG: penicillin-binding protein 1A [Candidatus Velthaea sp.]
MAIGVTPAAKRKRKKNGKPVNRGWLVVRGLAVVVAFGVLLFAGVVAGIVTSYSKDLPDINRMADYQPSRSTRVFARDGSLLANLYKQNRTWVGIDKIPVVVRNAFVATEDRNFYSHHGVDITGIARAAFADWRHERFQGASTITQQLARALFLSNEVSISRKIQEALLAIEIERYYTKDEILERYLNLIYFGSGAYGIEAAAHTYFGTDVQRLTIGQAAMLAGMPAAPSVYSPYVNLQHAKERQVHVLERMVASGFITQAQARSEETRKLALIGERPAGLQSYKYPYFTTYVTHVIESQFGTQSTFEGGLQVYTTLDPAMQKIAESAIDWGVGRAKAEGIGAHQAALVALRPSTGEIVAMVGGAGGFSVASQFNRAWQARRQPGSSFKVFVYTAAVDSGMPPSSIVEDTPVNYPMGDGTRWAPMDDDNRFFGAITLRYALAQSRNVVAVKLAQQLGIDRVIEYAKRMGIKEPLQANLSLALGSSVVTPLDMASGYSTLANGGVHVDPSPIRVVRDSLGSPILDNTYPQQTEVVSAGTAYVMTNMMTSVIKEGTGFPNAELGRPAAGKTGTTSDFRDAWFVGFTPDLVTAVWLGNDNYKRMYESYGGNIPARIWARFMKAALAKTPKHDFVLPAGEVRKVTLCGSNKPEVFLVGTEPSHTCGNGEDVPAHKKRKTADAAIATPPAVAAAAPPEPISVSSAAADAPPNSIGDGTNFTKLEYPSPVPAKTP